MRRRRAPILTALTVEAAAALLLLPTAVEPSGAIRGPLRPLIGRVGLTLVFFFVFIVGIPQGQGQAQSQGLQPQP